MATENILKGLSVRDNKLDVQLNGLNFTVTNGLISLKTDPDGGIDPIGSDGLRIRCGTAITVDGGDLSVRCYGKTVGKDENNNLLVLYNDSLEVGLDRYGKTGLGINEEYVRKIVTAQVGDLLAEGGSTSIDELKDIVEYIINNPTANQLVETKAHVDKLIVPTNTSGLVYDDSGLQVKLGTYLGRTKDGIYVDKNTLFNDMLGDDGAFGVLDTTGKLGVFTGKGLRISTKNDLEVAYGQNLDIETYDNGENRLVVKTQGAIKSNTNGIYVDAAELAGASLEKSPSGRLRVKVGEGLSALQNNDESNSVLKVVLEEKGGLEFNGQALKVKVRHSDDSDKGTAGIKFASDGALMVACARNWDPDKPSAVGGIIITGPSASLNTMAGLALNVENDQFEFTREGKLTVKTAGLINKIANV